MDIGKINDLGRIPLTLNQVDSVYWLGRYSERVLSTLRIFIHIFDRTIDNSFDLEDYCRRLDIYNGFTSLNDFCKRYPFDRTYPDSIINSMNRAYDNAVVLREVIGTDALSYIEMALQSLKGAEASKSPVLAFQQTIDYIMAFKGCVTDTVIDRNVRNIISCGAGVERLDLYLRLDINQDRILFECQRLAQAIVNTDVKIDDLELQKICGGLCQEESVQDNADKIVLLSIIDSLFMIQNYYDAP